MIFHHLSFYLGFDMAWIETAKGVGVLRNKDSWEVHAGHVCEISWVCDNNTFYRLKYLFSFIFRDALKMQVNQWVNGTDNRSANQDNLKVWNNFTYFFLLYNNLE